MIELGKLQKLIIVKIEHHGAYLGETQEAGPEDRILLPAKQIPEGSGVGDEVRAFVYRDSQDRLIATTVQPKVLLHGVALLRVSQVTKIGAFLDWGLEKDLLLPFHEQTKKVKEGEDVLVALYVDKGSRLAATMKLYPYLRQDLITKTSEHLVRAETSANAAGGLQSLLLLLSCFSCVRLCVTP